MKNLYRMTFDCGGGATLENASREAYQLAQSVGFTGPVYVIHNDKRYRVVLDAREEGTDAERK